MQTIITEENPFALAFKNMAEVEDEEIRRAALEGHSVSVVKMSLLEGQDVAIISLHIMKLQLYLLVKMVHHLLPGKLLFTQEVILLKLSQVCLQT